MTTPPGRTSAGDDEVPKAHENRESEMPADQATRAAPATRTQRPSERGSWVRVLGLVYLFTTPIETIPVSVPILESPARAAGLLFLVGWGAEILSGRRRPRLSPWAVLVLAAMVTWSAVGVLWSHYPPGTVAFVQAMLGLALGALAISDVFRDEVRKPALAMTLGALVAAAPLFFTTADVMRANRSAYLGIDENITAFHLVLGIAAAIFLIISRSTPRAKLWLTGGVVALFVAVLLTGSRSGVGAAILVGIVALAVSLRSITTAVLGIALVAITYAALIWARAADVVPKRVTEWMENPFLDDERATIIDAYLQFQDVWFWKGTGGGTDSYFLGGAAGLPLNAHNGFWALWIELGIVGLVLWILMAALLLWYALRAPGRLWLLLSLPAIVAFTYTLGPNQSNMLWALAGVALAGYGRPRRGISRRDLPTTGEVGARGAGAVINRQNSR